MIHIEAELYGEQIGVNGNMSRLIRDKQCRILLSISDEKRTSKVQIVLSKDEAISLTEEINGCFDAAADVGYEVV